MTAVAPSPRPNHCATCTCGAKRPVFEELRLRRLAAEYIEALGADGGNIDGDPGGVDRERIEPFADYIAEEAVAAGFRLRVTWDEGLRRLITTVYKRKETGT